MSFRNKLHARIHELSEFRKRCWKQCKKWVKKSRHSFQQNTTFSLINENNYPIFGATISMIDHTNLQNDDASEDSYTSDIEQAWSTANQAECNLTECEQEKLRREKRLARTRNSLRNASTKSERKKFQMQAQREQSLRAMSDNNISRAEETWRRENEYYCNVMSIISQKN